jgi:phosphoribosyl-ATP pyrophosphohydrolase
MTTFTLDDLARIVAERAAAPATESYTAKLIAGGPAKAAKKLGEEAVEAAIAAVEGDRQNLTAEAVGSCGEGRAQDLTWKRGGSHGPAQPDVRRRGRRRPLALPHIPP